MDIILSTGNPSKVLQVAGLFEGSHVQIRSLRDVGIEGGGNEGDSSLEENALIKSRYARSHVPDTWTMADDTGLFIEALGGEPGVRSARWAGDKATTLEILHYTLERMQGQTDRRAVFRTAVAVIAPDGREHLFLGECLGTLLEVPRAEPQSSMPYSPIFMPSGEDRVWAQMSTEEENALSHRGIAFRKVRAFLEEQDA